MNVLLTRWTSGGQPSRLAIEEAFRREHLAPNWWSNGPGDTYGAHFHSHDKLLYCAGGSIVFRVEPGGKEYELRPGDRLEIPCGTPHSAVVGVEGVTCAEAAR